MSAQPAEAPALSLRPASGWEATALDSERQLVGSLLTAPDAVADMVNPDDIADARLQRVARVALAMTVRGITPTPIAVAREINDPRTDLAFVLDVMEEAYTLGGVASAAGSAQIVRENAERRRVVDAAHKVQLAAADGVDTDALRELLVSVPPSTAKRAKTMRDVVQEMSDEGPLLHESTGLPTIDAMTGGGLEYGSVHTINGAPSASKTATLAQIAHGYAMRGVQVGFHCCDESESNVVTRFMQRQGFQRAQCERREPEDLARMAAAAVDGILFFDDETSVESAFADLVREAHRNGRRACMVIDSLQTCASEAEPQTTNEAERLSSRLRTIRNLGRRHRVLVLLSSEMNRGAYRSRVESERVADMAAGMGSARIEFYSRFLANLGSVKGETDVVEMRVAKNKIGAAQIHAEGEPGLFLRISRAEQSLVELPDYVKGGSDGDADADAVADEAITRVLDKLREIGSTPSANNLVGRIKGVHRSTLLTAFKEAKHVGWIVNTGTSREPAYVVSASAPLRVVPGRVCVVPPSTPGSGNREPAGRRPGYPEGGSAIGNQTEPDGTSEGVPRD